jgi:hypothetical protein
VHAGARTGSPGIVPKANGAAPKSKSRAPNGEAALLDPSAAGGAHTVAEPRASGNSQGKDLGEPGMHPVGMRAAMSVLGEGSIGGVGGAWAWEFAAADSASGLACLPDHSPAA